MSLKETFAANLERFRHPTGLTRSQAAQLIGVSRQTYHDWEEGRGSPSFERLEDVARVLRVPVCALFMEGFGGEIGQ